MKRDVGFEYSVCIHMLLTYPEQSGLNWDFWGSGVLFKRKEDCRFGVYVVLPWSQLTHLT